MRSISIPSQPYDRRGRNRPFILWVADRAVPLRRSNVKNRCVVPGAQDFIGARKLAAQFSTASGFASFANQ